MEKMYASYAKYEFVGTAPPRPAQAGLAEGHPVARAGSEAVAGGQGARRRVRADRPDPTLDDEWIPRVTETRRLTPNIMEVIVHAPAAARQFEPGGRRRQHVTTRTRDLLADFATSFRRQAAPHENPDF